MIWQDFVFLIGSMTSVLFLYPTLRDSASQVPRATSVPSMVIGGTYSVTFFTLGMTFSAFGAFAACTMWSLIAAFRSPDGETAESSSLDELRSMLAARYEQFRSTDTDTNQSPTSIAFDGGVEDPASEAATQCDD